LPNTLKNKYIHQIIIAASQMMLPLLSYPYITRVLGPFNIGLVNYVDFLAQLFIIFAAFGIPFYAVREVATTNNDVFKRSILVKELTILHTCFSIIAATFFVILTYKQWGNNFILYGLAIANILISAFTFDWYIQGTEAFAFAAYRYLIIRAVLLLAFFVCIKYSHQYALYYALYTIGLLAMAIVNAIKVFTENNFYSIPIHFKRHLKPLTHFFLTASAISIYIYFDTILLQYFTHNTLLVGYYTTAVKLVKIFLTVLLAIGTVLLPRLSYLVSKGNGTEVKNYLDAYFNFIITIGLPISAGLAFLAPEIIEIVAGKNFIPAAPLVQILAMLPFIISLSNLFCFQTLVPFNKEHQFLVIVIIGCIASVSLNVLFIPIMGVQGAAWANVITECIITLLAAIQAYKLIKFTFSIHIIVQTIVSVLLFLPIIIAIRYNFSSTIFVAIFSVISCIVGYLVLQIMLFKNKILIQIVQHIKHLFTF
jgi:O-antigen/teichoic acid export membrane protein